MRTSTSRKGPKFSGDTDERRHAGLATGQHSLDLGTSEEPNGMAADDHRSEALTTLARRGRVAATHLRRGDGALPGSGHSSGAQTSGVKAGGAAATAGGPTKRQLDQVPLGERMALSVEEAGALLGISRDLAYDLVARGELPSVRLGRRLVVPRRALEGAIERLLDAG